MTGSLVGLRQVRQRYAGRIVLNVDQLDVGAGSILGLTGANGSGKSTLLRLLALVETPSAGAVTFQGRPLAAPTLEIRRQVTLLAQEPYLLKRSVFANIAFGLRARGAPDLSERVRKGLRLVGLDPEDFAGRQWHQLSGGETKRVALAARLVLRPRLLLLDEPTANLDEPSAALVRRAALAARQEQGTALVIASHDLTWLRAVCDRILHLEQGVIAEPAADAPRRSR